MNKKVEKILKENPDVWKSKASLMSYIRGGLRRSLWMRHPIKLKLMKEHRQRIPNPNPNGRNPEVWGGKCSCCGELFAQKDLEVDHIREDSNTLNDVSDIQEFVENLALVTKDDLRIVCKGCHTIISYMQKTGLSFEDAKLEKEIISVCKDKELVIAKLKEYGVKDLPKTIKARKELVTKYMREHN